MPTVSVPSNSSPKNGNDGDARTQRRGPEGSADGLLARIAAGAAERERTRELPHAQIRELAAAGLLTFCVPVRYGGPGSSVRELFGFLIDLAAADSNIAQSLRSSFGFVESLIATGSDAECDRWFPRVLAGEVFGNAGWEIGGPNGVVRATIHRDGDGGSATRVGHTWIGTGSTRVRWPTTIRGRTRRPWSARSTSPAHSHLHQACSDRVRRGRLGQVGESVVASSPRTAQVLRWSAAEPRSVRVNTTSVAPASM